MGGKLFFVPLHWSYVCKLARESEWAESCMLYLKGPSTSSEQREIGKNNKDSQGSRGEVPEGLIKEPS